MAAAAFLLFAMSCGGQTPGQSADAGSDAEAISDVRPDAQAQADTDAIDYDERLTALLAEAGAAPVASAPAFDEAKVRLGHGLFFDPILSGNRDTSCATCHRMDEGTSVRRALAVGTHFVERDGERFPGPGHSFTPRKSPPLFNLGDENTSSLLWDGRVTQNEDGQFVIFDKGWEKSEENFLRFLPTELDNLLAAQTMMPVLSRDELRGDHGEVDIEGNPNELAIVHDQNLEGVWSALVDRLMAVEEYRTLFAEAYPQVAPDEVEFAHASNALSAFIIDAFTLTDSPFDDYLRGDADALTEQQKRGAYLFYGEADCARCHSGALLSDEKLRNIGVRPLGPGPEVDYDVDMGAIFRTHGGEADKFAFRTPSLRNVELTGPYMHNGVYTTLEAALRHHLDVRDGLRNYDPSQLDEEFQRYVHNEPELLDSVEETLVDIEATTLTDDEVDALLAFLESLTSPTARELDELEPQTVPSGLPLPDP